MFASSGEIRVCIYLDVLGDVDLAGPQVAQAGLFDQLALLVGVGDPQRHAPAAGLRTWAPGGGLGDAVLVPAPDLSWENWLHVNRKVT